MFVVVVVYLSCWLAPLEERWNFVVVVLILLLFIACYLFVLLLWFWSLCCIFELLVGSTQRKVEEIESRDRANEQLPSRSSVLPFVFINSVFRFLFIYISTYMRHVFFWVDLLYLPDGIKCASLPLILYCFCFYCAISLKCSNLKMCFMPIAPCCVCSTQRIPIWLSPRRKWPNTQKNGC